MNMDRKKELAVVTGGAVRLGREITLALAAAGYDIGLHYHTSRSEAEQTAREIQAAGGQVELLQADLTDSTQIATLFKQIASLPVPLRVLVNSAAVMLRGNLLTMEVEEWDATLNLNLRAVWLCAKAAADLMQPAGGCIINISDSGAGKTWSGFPAYVISKAGLETLTRLLARSLAPEIRVNAVAPGLILPSAETSPEEFQRLVQRLPAGHAGTPADVVQAILFLLENQYITGETVYVDGGYQLI